MNETKQRWLSVADEEDAAAKAYEKSANVAGGVALVMLLLGAAHNLNLVIDLPYIPEFNDETIDTTLAFGIPVVSTIPMIVMRILNSYAKDERSNADHSRSIANTW